MALGDARSVAITLIKNASASARGCNGVSEKRALANRKPTRRDRSTLQLHHRTCQRFKSPKVLSTPPPQARAVIRNLHTFSTFSPRARIGKALTLPTKEAAVVCKHQSCDSSPPSGEEVRKKKKKKNTLPLIRAVKARGVLTSFVERH